MCHAQGIIGDYYSLLQETTHGEQFKQDLVRNMKRHVGLDTIMRLRTSTGMSGFYTMCILYCDAFK